MTDDSSPEFQLAKGVFVDQAFTALLGARVLRFEPGVASADITSIATVVARTKRQAVVNCEVRSVDSEGNEILVAIAQGTATIVER